MFLEYETPTNNEDLCEHLGLVRSWIDSFIQTISFGISGWTLQWRNFLKYLTWLDPTTGRRWIDPTMLRRWFQGIVDKSNIKNLTDFNVTRVTAF